MPFSPVVLDRERDKFLENPAGETSVRVFVSNETADALPVTGAFNISAPTGPFDITVVTATDVAANPLPSPLSDRVSLSIRNLSQADTVYFGKNAFVTADTAATGGWEIGPGEDFNIDLNDTNAFFLIAETGKTAIIKILEVASTASGGGAVAGIEIQEQLAGTIDGVNLIFTVSQTPLSDASFKLYRSGIYQPPANYSRVGVTITMVVAPDPGMQLDADYVY